MKSMLVPLALLLPMTLTSSATPDVQQPPDTVEIKVEKDQIDFLAGKQLVTTYHTKNTLPRPCFWPLRSPNGIETTRAWPMGNKLPGEVLDHPHHRSAWFTYGDVVPEGIALKTKTKGIEGVDFWTEGMNTGKIICTKVDGPTKGQLSSSVVTHNEWRTVDGVKVMDETRRIHFYRTGQAYLIVLDIDLIASVCPITFADTKEGAMAIRIHPSITVVTQEGKAGKPNKGTMQNADGKINEKECWGQKSAWCDYSGKIGANVVGVAVLDDPGNPHPACWHARDYGLMAANPFGREKHAKFPGAKGNNEVVRVGQGKHLNLRYGILIHNGNAVDGQVEAHFQRFIKFREKETR